MSRLFISGRLGRAVLEDGETLVAIAPGRPNRPASLRDFREVNGESASADFRNVSSLEEADQVTLDAKRFEDSLFLAISAINPDLTLTCRLACSKYLEESLDSATSDRLLSRLLSAPLPVTVRAKQASLLEVIGAFPKLSLIFQQVFDSQDAVETVAGALKEALRDVSYSQQQDIRGELDALGTASRLSIALKNGDRDAVNSASVEAAFQLNKLPSAFSAKLVVSTVSSRIKRSFLKTHERATHRSEAQRKAQSPHSRTSRMTIEELLASDIDGSLSRLSIFEKKSNVDRQLEGIRKQILEGRRDLVTKYVTQLVEFQLNHSEKIHLGKSLCFLSTMSLAANQLEMADELSSYALSLNIEDPYILNTRGEVQKQMGLFDAALATFRTAQVRYLQSSHAWNGAADVLKDAGRFDEALKEYKAVQERFPENPVAYNGYVSTLRKMGGFAAARKEATKTRDRFPDDPVIETELGHCYLAEGKTAKALYHYRRSHSLDSSNTFTFRSYLRALSEHGQGHVALTLAIKRASAEPQNPALQNTLAVQYRLSGKLALAEQQSEAVLKMFPGYTPAKYAFASVLMLRGKLEQAASNLPANQLRSESDWRGFCVYLVLLLRSDPKKALAEIQTALNECPWIGLRASLSTLLAVALAQNRKRTEAISVLQTDLNHLEDHKKQTRLALIGAIRMVSNQKPTGELILRRVMATREAQLKSFRAHVLSKPNISSTFITPLLLAA